MNRFRLLLIPAAGFCLASSLLAQDLSQPYVEGQILVRFAPGAAAVDRDVARRALLPQGGRVLGLVPGLELVLTGIDVPEAIAVLSNNPNVLYVEPDYIVQPITALPNDDYFDLQWGLDNSGQGIPNMNPVYGDPIADIDMHQAWDAETVSTSTLVAVIDTGTQLDHEDLEDNIWTNPGETPGDGVDNDENGFIDDVHGWDFFDDDNDPSDENGHGTHTAGTVAAIKNNNIGIAGVCGNCKIMVLRFLGPNGGSTSNAILALEYAVNNNAAVSNNSWGGGGYSQSLYDAIKAAGDKDHIFVAAAGNNGTDTDVFPHYPSSYDLDLSSSNEAHLWNLISVAATTNLDQRASFSNYGTVSVDLGAPGLDIASLYWDPLTSGVDDYWWNSGTSMAAPHVTGVVAMLLALNQNITPDDPNCSNLADARSIVDRVLDSARQAPAMLNITVTGGVLNAYNAVAGICPLPITPVNPPPELVAPANLIAADGENGTVVLSWTAVAGATYYLIERREWKTRGRNGGSWVGGQSFQIFEPLSDPPLIDSTVVAGPRYGYRIASGTPADTSIMSNPWVEVTVTDGSDDGGGDSGGTKKCHPKKGC
ncbi:MAG: hypothetical protein E2O51_07000 [Gammaproteobacteria bacterium]|nr:MAG: hypothetical protein E2O51_07000 [Gammaproteobacteria bacterium]